MRPAFLLAWCWNGASFESQGELMTSTAKTRSASLDLDWYDLSTEFRIRPDSIYLNHGSFGIPLNRVRYARRRFIDQLDENPMDFYLRQIEGLSASACQALAAFVHTEPANLVFADNATFAMNVVAANFPLVAGDEVLLSDHEYGPVYRIWESRCQRIGARVVVVPLPQRVETIDQVVSALLVGVTEKTRLLVVSHITSPTALLMPIKEICAAFTRVGVATCIDGPHAPAQIALDIDQLHCDFYTASCHKWLCATLGSGFLYAHPRWHDRIEPIITSWGRLPPAVPQSWHEKFLWQGTRDPSSFLAIPVAIEFLNQLGPEKFRLRSQWLARYAEAALCELFKTEPIGKREHGWYGSMAHVPLPPGDWSGLQRELWDQIGIEVMINRFSERWFIRVSCHLYNHQTQIDTLIKALFRLCRRAAVH